MCVCIYVCTYICNVCVCKYLCKYVLMYISTYKNIYLYVCMYVYHVQIFIYTYNYAQCLRCLFCSNYIFRQLVVREDQSYLTNKYVL